MIRDSSTLTKVRGFTLVTMNANRLSKEKLRKPSKSQTLWKNSLPQTETRKTMRVMIRTKIRMKLTINFTRS